MRESDLPAFHRMLSMRTSATLRAPNVIGVGACRAGSTQLWGLLERAEDVYTAPVKELNYFGILAGPRFDWDDYRTFFADAGEARWRAEVTPVYLTHRPSLPAIAAAAPNAKIVITLRDPLDRFVSEFIKHRHRHGFDDLTAYADAALSRFSNATFASTNWFAPEKALAGSLYARGVNTALTLFDPADVLILYLEEEHARPGAWSAQLSAFLGVDIPATASPDRRNANDMTVPFPFGEVADRITELFDADFAALPQAIRERAPWRSGESTPQRWRDAPSYAGLYQIGDSGEVRPTPDAERAQSAPVLPSPFADA